MSGELDRLRTVRPAHDDYGIGHDIQWAVDEIDQLRTGLDGMKAGVAIRIADLEARLTAAKIAAPAWHDRPTGPGLWLCVTAGKKRRLRIVTPRAAAHWYEKGRVYGPIPHDVKVAL